MTHLQPRQIVTVSVVSTDSELLDSLEAEIPSADADAVDELHSVKRVADGTGLEADEERLIARVAFRETEDGTAASAHASDLYAAVVAYDLAGRASRHTARHYESPLGGVSSNEIENYYREHPDEQPTNEDGEAYVPSSWNPSNHVVDETSG